ncbi:hypothetical protein GWK47_033112 [Chionoecetes opilio]|uniref:Uncharacterized protein n=1 Tax=Chionoecetes opilio TaxID=41210 RepID=A0A8J4YSR6_CHIOP|nr:hypothetical protein GWK47_033112 [Chionoecetes opilio]
MNPGSHTLPLRVDHAVGEEGIASMWGDHFKGIFNCVRDQESENAMRGGMRGVSLQGFRSMDHKEMIGILQKLSSSEVLGMHGLPSGAFKYAPLSLVTLLCLFINACVCHQYIPKQLERLRPEAPGVGQYSPKPFLRILENLVPNHTAISDLSAQHINPRTGRKARRRTLPSDAPARIKTLLSTSLPHIGPKLFNNLPGKLRNLTECSVEKLKHHLDNHLQTIPDEPPVPGYTSVSRADTNSISDQVSLQHRDAGYGCSGGAPRL